VGTRFSFTLNQAATVTLTFTQSRSGRLTRKRCVAQTAKNRHAKACRYSVARGTLSINGVPGANAVSFDGRVGKHSLPAGRYVLTFVATAGGLTTRPQSLVFTIAT
jgi:hypothetical protein